MTSQSSTQPAPPEQINVQAIARLAQQRTALLEQLSLVIVGQHEVVENVLLTIFCGRNRGNVAGPLFFDEYESVQIADDVEDGPRRLVADCV